MLHELQLMYVHMCMNMYNVYHRMLCNDLQHSFSGKEKGKEEVNPVD